LDEVKLDGIKVGDLVDIDIPDRGKILGAKVIRMPNFNQGVLNEGLGVESPVSIGDGKRYVTNVTVFDPCIVTKHKGDI
jgi:hypothetical protein